MSVEGNWVRDGKREREIRREVGSENITKLKGLMNFFGFFGLFGLFGLFRLFGGSGEMCVVWVVFTCRLAMPRSQ